MDKPSILFFLEGLSYRVAQQKKIRRWLGYAIRLEKKKPGNINFILCTDAYLHNLNRTYLKHDALTDVITFDYTEKGEYVSGDVYISLDRVRENAKQFGVPVVQELYRIMIHGVLHLVGYSDKDANQKRIMRSKEDYYLSLLPDFLG